MALSDARKRANKKYDAENIQRVGVVMKKDLHNLLVKYCEDTGKTKSRVFTDLLKKELTEKGYMEEETE